MEIRVKKLRTACFARLRGAECSIPHTPTPPRLRYACPGLERGRLFEAAADASCRIPWQCLFCVPIACRTFSVSFRAGARHGPCKRMHVVGYILRIPALSSWVMIPLPSERGVRGGSLVFFHPIKKAKAFGLGFFDGYAMDAGYSPQRCMMRSREI